MTELALPLSYFTVGDGAETTILLHGFLGSGRNLSALAKRWAELEPSRRFVLPDLSGHGDSPPLTADGDLDDMARAVLATARVAGATTPVSIVGHSLGGRVALAAARVEPQALSEITLLDIAPGPIDPASSDTRRVLDVLLVAPAEAPDRRALRDFFTGRGLSPSLADWILMNVRLDAGRYVWRIDRGALDRLHDRFNRDDLWPVVDAHAVPLRCARGGHSRYVSDADVARLEAGGCPVITFVDAGHYLHVDALPALVEWLFGK